MNSETTDLDGTVGRVFYDAECPVCRVGFRLAHRFFRRRGFEWLPLQTTGLAARLGLPEHALMEEMKLELADGRVLGGIDSWTCLFRTVWWLWPLGMVLSLPGIHAFAQAAYGWFARHRYCVAPKRGPAQPRPGKRKIPFFDLP